MFYYEMLAIIFQNSQERFSIISPQRNDKCWSDLYVILNRSWKMYTYIEIYTVHFINKDNLYMSNKIFKIKIKLKKLIDEMPWKLYLPK